MKRPWSYAPVFKPTQCRPGPADGRVVGHPHSETSGESSSSAWRLTHARSKHLARLDRSLVDRSVSSVPLGWDDGPERAKLEHLTAMRAAKDRTGTAASAGPGPLTLGDFRLLVACIDAANRRSWPCRIRVDETKDFNLGTIDV